MCGSNKSEAGFTLLEVMVAGAILAVGLGAVFTLYSTSLRAVAQGKGYAEARLLAESLMSKTLFDLPTPPFRRKGRGTVPVGSSWEIVGEPDELVSGAVLVTVTVTTGEKSRTVQLKTCQADMSLSGKREKGETYANPFDPGADHIADYGSGRSDGMQQP